MRLRPPGLEEGLMTGLKQYGERLKLHVSSHINGIRTAPDRGRDIVEDRSRGAEQCKQACGYEGSKGSINPAGK